MKKVLLLLFTLLFMMVLMEGGASIVLNAYDTVYAYMHFGQAEGSSTETQFDVDLGWANKPSMRVENKFGPGKTLTTNKQGFRRIGDVALEKPAGITRMVMIGDSFVFGSENADEHTIPAELEKRMSRVECVNLGVPGYGVDQAYLNYVKNGRPLNPDVILFGVLPVDFERASTGRYRTGYHKPLIKLENGQLRVTNVPVPPPLPARSSLFTRKDAVLWYLDRTATSRMLKKILKAVGVQTDPVLRGIDYGLHIMSAILRDLKVSGDGNAPRVVVISLPMVFDYLDGQRTRAALDFQSRLQVACDQAGVQLLDLGDVFAGMPEDTLKEHFHADWHYNDSGTVVVAEALAQRLKLINPARSESSMD